MIRYLSGYGYPPVSYSRQCLRSRSVFAETGSLIGNLDFGKATVALPFGTLRMVFSSTKRTVPLSRRFAACLSVAVQNTELRLCICICIYTCTCACVSYVPSIAREGSKRQSRRQSQSQRPGRLPSKPLPATRPCTTCTCTTNNRTICALQVQHNECQMIIQPTLLLSFPIGWLASAAGVMHPYSGWSRGRGCTHMHFKHVE